MALSVLDRLHSRAPDVIWRPALWSPDFPPLDCSRSRRPTGSYTYINKKTTKTSPHFENARIHSRTFKLSRYCNFNRFFNFHNNCALKATKIVETATTSGTAKPKACGHAITMTVTIRSIAKSKVFPISIQVIKVINPADSAIIVRKNATLMARAISVIMPSCLLRISLVRP